MGCQVVKESKATNLLLINTEVNYGTNCNFLIMSLLHEWIKSYLNCRTEGAILPFVQNSQEQQSQLQNQEYSDNEKEYGSIKFSLCEIFLEIMSIFLNVNLQEIKHNPIEKINSHIKEQNEGIIVFDQSSSQNYSLKSSTLFVRNIIYKKYQILQNVLTSSKKNASYNPSLYDSIENLIKLGEIAWNIGIILNNTNENKNDNYVENNLEKIELGIDFLEISNQIFLFVDSTTTTINYQNSIQLTRFKCLLSSTSLRMDISTILNDFQDYKSKEDHNNLKVNENIESKSNFEDSEKRLAYELKNLKCIEYNLSILSEFVKDFTNLPEELKKLYLMLSIAYYCRINSSELEGFIESNQANFLMFTPLELEKCADITQNEKFGNLTICRKMLLFGIQVITREKISSYYLLGNFYRRLIHLSPSRLQALEWIEDFEQILKSITKEEITSISLDDIDSICIMCYNWGITLVELNQYDLAEKFAGKALNFTKYVSSKVSNLKETIQVRK